MKIYQLAFGLVAAATMVFTSCKNEQPSFSDADAFVAFQSGTVSAAEGGDAVQIPVLLTSLSGIATDIEVEVIDSTAVEGKDFTVANKKLSFTKDAPIQYITVNVANDDEYTGSRVFTLVLKQGSVNLGAAKTCLVSIADDEHPLTFLFGTYKTHIIDNWGDEYDIVGTITRDADDDHKVWFNQIFTPWLCQVQGFQISFYGMVNDEKTEISIPAGQETGVSASGVPIVLYVSDDETLDGEMFDSGKNIIVTINDEEANTLTIVNAWGASNGSGWYDLSTGNVTLTKQ